MELHNKNMTLIKLLLLFRTTDWITSIFRTILSVTPHISKAARWLGGKSRKGKAIKDYSIIGNRKGYNFDEECAQITWTGKSRSLSRKFCSAENFGLGPVFSEKIVTPGTNFLKKRVGAENFVPVYTLLKIDCKKLAIWCTNRQISLKRGSKQLFVIALTLCSQFPIQCCSRIVHDVNYIGFEQNA